MTFDKLFEKQSLLVKILLLLIPGVSIVCEVFVRISIYLRTKSILSLIMLIVAILSFGVVLGILDIISILLTGKLFLAE